MNRSKVRALAWSKEVERRARDLYKRAWPATVRAKFVGREDYAGHPDLVGLPIHVQVKARDLIWISSEYRKAVLANRAGHPRVHLVVQDTGGPMLVVMKLSDYVEDICGTSTPSI